MCKRDFKVISWGPLVPGNLFDWKRPFESRTSHVWKLSRQPGKVWGESDFSLEWCSVTLPSVYFPCTSQDLSCKYTYNMLSCIPLDWGFKTVSDILAERETDQTVGKERESICAFVWMKDDNVRERRSDRAQKEVLGVYRCIKGRFLNIVRFLWQQCSIIFLKGWSNRSYKFIIQDDVVILLKAKQM